MLSPLHRGTMYPRVPVMLATSFRLTQLRPLRSEASSNAPTDPTEPHWRATSASGYAYICCFIMLCTGCLRERCVLLYNCAFSRVSDTSNSSPMLKKTRSAIKPRAPQMSLNRRMQVGSLPTMLPVESHTTRPINRFPFPSTAQTKGAWTQTILQ